MLTSNKVTQSNKDYYQKLGYESYLHGREDSYGYFSGKGVEKLNLGDPKIVKDDPRLKLLLQGKDIDLKSLRNSQQKPRETYYLQKKGKRKRIRLSKDEVALLEGGAHLTHQWTEKLHKKVQAFGEEADPQNYVTKVMEGGVLAYDQVFSAPKDLSILWALASNKEDKERFLQIHLEAVAQGLDVLQEHSYIRCGAGGKELVKADATFAQFTHELSRDRDMQLHTHCLQFNVGLTEDGRSGALDARKLFDVNQLAGMAYQNHARSCLELEGFTTYDRPFSNDQGTSFGIEGITARVRDEFSQRTVATRGQIDSSMSARQIRQEFLKTRRAKETDIASQEIFYEWNARASALGFSCQELIDKAATRTDAHVEKGSIAEQIQVHAACDTPINRVQGSSFATQELFKPSSASQGRSAATAGAATPPKGKTNRHVKEREKIGWQWKDIDRLVEEHQQLTTITHRFPIPLSVQQELEKARKSDCRDREREQDLKGAIHQASDAAIQYLGKHTFECVTNDKKEQKLHAKVVKPIFLGNAHVTNREVIMTQLCRGRNGSGTPVPISKEGLFRAQEIAAQVFVNTLQETQERQGYSTTKFNYNATLNYAPFLIEGRRREPRTWSRPSSRERKQEILRNAFHYEITNRNRGIYRSTLEECALYATQGEMHPKTVLKQLTNPSFTKKYFKTTTEYDTVVARNEPLYQLNERGLDDLSLQYRLEVSTERELKEVSVSDPHRYQQLETAHHNAVNTTISYLQEYHTVAAKSGDTLRGNVKQVVAKADLSTTLYHRPYGINEKGLREIARQSKANQLTVQLLYDNALTYELGKVGMTTSKQKGEDGSYRTALKVQDRSQQDQQKGKDCRTQAEIDNRAVLFLLHQQEVYQARNESTESEGKDRLLSSTQHLNAFLRADGGTSDPLDVVERVKDIHQKLSKEVLFERSETRIDPVTLKQTQRTYNQRYYQIQDSVADRAYHDLSLTASDEIALVYHTTTDGRLRSIIEYALTSADEVAMRELKKQQFSNHMLGITGLQPQVIQVERSQLSRNNTLPRLQTTIRVKAVFRNEQGETGLISRQQLWQEQQFRLERIRNNHLRFTLQQFGIKTYIQDTKTNAVGLEGVSSKLMRGINRRWGRVVQYRYSLANVAAVMERIKEYSEGSNPKQSYQQQQQVWRTCARQSGLRFDAAASSHLLNGLKTKLLSVPALAHAHARDTEISITKRAATYLFCREKQFLEQVQRGSLSEHMYLKSSDIELAFLTAASGKVSSENVLEMATRFMQHSCSLVEVVQAGAETKNVTAPTTAAAAEQQQRYTLNHNAYRHVDAKTRLEQIGAAYKTLVALHRSCKTLAYTIKQQNFHAKLTWLYATGKVTRKTYVQYRQGFTLPESRFTQALGVSLGLYSRKQVQAQQKIRDYHNVTEKRQQRDTLRYGGGYYRDPYQETQRQRSLKNNEWGQLVKQIQREAQQQGAMTAAAAKQSDRRHSRYDEWEMGM